MTTTQHRTTVPLKVTTARTSAQLDQVSATALAWAQHWLRAADSTQRHPAGLKVPASGVMRRALRLYVQHLEALAPEGQREEVRQVHRCCTERAASQEAQEATAGRLRAIPPGDRPPPFVEILLGPGVVECVGADRKLTSKAA